MTQLGGDFVFGPGALHSDYFFICLDPHGRQDRRVHLRRECSMRRTVSTLETVVQDLLTHFCSDIEVAELIQHLGITARPSSFSQTLTALAVNERSRRDCAELLPDELVVVPSQMNDLKSIPSP